MCSLFCAECRTPDIPFCQIGVLMERTCVYLCVAGCVIYACGVGFFGLLSIVTLSAIAVERYMVITAKPFSGNWKITQYAARKVSLALFL